MKRKLIMRLTGVILAGLLVFESMDLTAVAMGSELVLASESEVQEEVGDAESIPIEQEQPESAEETIVQESRQEETSLVDEASEAETEMSENENTAVSGAESETETMEQESITEDSEENSEKEDGEADTVLTSADDIASGTYGNVTWVIDKDGKLTVSGTGNFKKDSSTQIGAWEKVLWYDYADQIKTASVSLTEVTDMSYLFYGCNNLTDVDFSGTDTSNCTNMLSMFEDCTSLLSLDLTCFSTEKVTDMGYLFYNCTSLQSLNVSSFDTKNVTDMSCMFTSCESLETLDLSNFITSNVEIMGWDGIGTGEGMFYGCSKLRTLDISNFDASNVTALSGLNGMFAHCSSLETLDLKNFKTDNVGYMGEMFYDCRSLKELDLSSFNTSNVHTDEWYHGMYGGMERMFFCCENLESLDLSSFDTSNVEMMSDMFAYCKSLKSINLSSFNTENVTDMSSMFAHCESLESINISNFKTDKVTNMNSMFYYCEKLTSLDLSNFNAQKVDSATDMISDCDSLVEIKSPKNLTINVALPTDRNGKLWYDENNSAVEYLPVNKTVSVRLTRGDSGDAGDNIASGTYENVTWVIDKDGKLTVKGTGDYQYFAPWLDYASQIKTAEIALSGITKTYKMFYNCENLTEVDLTNLDTSGVTDMSFMFCGCKSVTELSLENFDTSNVKNMRDMFWRCESLGELDVTKFDTTNVTNMWGIFGICESLQKLDVTNFDTTNVTDMGYMFYHCAGLTELNITNFDTKNVTNMACMFNYCESLKKLDVTSFDTGNVEDMSDMFLYCRNLGELNLENFSTSKVTDMSGMFGQCGQFTQLDLGNFDTGKVTNMSDMFLNCWQLKDLNINNFDTVNTTDMSYMFYGCWRLKRIDVEKFSTDNVTNVERMFGNCRSIEQLNMENWNMAKVENCDHFLAGCETLTSVRSPQNLSQKIFLPYFKKEKYWISSDNCIFMELPRQAENSITLEYKAGVENSTWNEELIQEKMNNIQWTLSKDGKLTVTGTGDWKDGWKDNSVPWINATAMVKAAEINVSGSTSLWQMFDECRSLKEVDVSNLDVSEVTHIGFMFYECESLENLDLSTWNLGSVARSDDARYLLYGCESLKKINTPKNLKITISLPAGTWVNPDGETVTELPMNMSTSILLEKKEQEPEEESSEAEESSETEESSKIEESSSTEESIVEESSETEESSAEPESSKTEESSVEPESSETEESSESPESESEPDISDGIYIKKISDQTYSGTAIKPILKVYYNKKLLQEKTDYTVTYKNNINAGKATVTIKGKGNLTGSVTESFTIDPKDINDTDVIIEDRAFVYDGKSHKAAPVIEYKGKKLKLGKDFTVTYSETNYTEKGTYTISVQGCGNYTGVNNDAKITITDKGKNISNAKVSKIPTQEYNSGNAIVLSDNLLTVTLNKVTLTAGRDYDVSYINNINPGKATVIIKGKGEYAGTKKVTFTIRRTPAQLMGSMVINKNVIGTVQMIKGGCRPEPLLKSGDYTLIKNTDYTVSYKNNKNVGNKASVVVKGKGNYKGSITIPFTITEKSIASSDISIRVPDVPYMGKANKYKSTPVITDADGNALKAGKDYTIDSYSIDGVALDKKSNPENGSVITVTISGKGNYTGTITLQYRLNGTSITKARIKLSNKVYTGKNIEIGEADIVSATIKIGKQEQSLVLGKDFEIAAYSNNIKKGNATVIIKGIGAYAGEKKVTFKITAGTVKK